DEVRLEGGVYVSPAGATFAVPGGVTVVGGFAAGFGARNVASYPSVLDGDGKAISVVTVDGADVTLDGIVITGAGEMPSVAGRGLLKDSGGLLTMVDCVISNNWATGADGVVQGPAAQFTGGGTVVMEGCVVAGNGRGGSEAYQNWATGIYAYGVDMTIRGCRFSGHSCDPWANRTTWGGALAFVSGTLRVFDTVFEENTVSSNGGGGGAAWIGTPAASGTPASATVDVVFSNCLFRANSFTDYTLSNNGIGYGGAVAVRNVTGGSPVGFFQCTFVGNAAGNGYGGALYMDSGEVTLRNAIFWDSEVRVAGFSGADIYSAGGVLDADYLCLTSLKAPDFVRLPLGHALGVHVMTNDPCFASEAFPYDFHLKSQVGRWDGSGWVTDGVTSPCIDAGDPAFDANGEPAPNGGRINLGMYAGTAEASKSRVASLPLVDVLAPEPLGYTYYRLGGIVTNAAPNSADVLYICYGTMEIVTPGTNDWDTVVVGYPPAQTGVPFAVATPLLNKETTYYVRVYAGNAIGGTWSDIAEFETGDEWPIGYGVGGGAEVIHVRADAVGSGDGSDWYNAFTSLNDAMTLLGGDRTNVWIAGGDYPLSAHVDTPSGVNCVMLGGFTGAEFLPGERPVTEGWADAQTVIWGNGFCVTLNANHGALDNVLFAGFAAPPALRRVGNGDFAFSYCAFTNNTVSGGIALLALDGGNVTITRCLFSDNVTSQHTMQGFGVNASANTTLAVFDCDFSRNRGINAWESRSGRGYGIYFNGASLLVERCRFSGNEIGAHEPWTSPNGGVAIYLGGGTGDATVRHCLFEDNRLLFWPSNGATGYGHGPAIFADLGPAGTLLVEHCTLVGNLSEGKMDCDGAIFQRGGAMTLRNNIFWDNVWDKVWDDSPAAYDADLGIAEGSVASLGYNSFTASSPSSLRFLNGGAAPLTTLYGDPLFAAVGDCHLQSPFGRWDPTLGDFVDTDVSLSPCIDAGDPADPVGSEVAPNGRRINLGMYGGTAEASKSFDPSGIDVELVKCVVSDHTQMKLFATTASAASVGACTVGFAYGTSAGAPDSTNGWQHVTILPALQPVGAEFSALTRYLATDTAYAYMAFVMAETFVCSTNGAFTTGSTLPDAWGIGGGAGIVHLRKEAYGNADGSDWFNAYTVVEDALAALTPLRPTLWIGDGAYYHAGEITFADGQRILGGFDGTETAETQRTGTAMTTFDGSGQTRPVYIEEGDILLDTIAIANIHTPNVPRYATVAALNKTGTGTLAMVNCKVTGNGTTVYDPKWGVGCHFAAEGEVIMERCEVSGNTATGHSPHGVGIYSAGDLTLIDCLVADNHGVSSDGTHFETRSGQGFGISAEGGSLTLIRTEVIGNYGGACQAPGGGGGVYVGGTMTNAFFLNCLFRDNRLYHGGSQMVNANLGSIGAALAAVFPRADIPLTILNCTFAGNRADGYNSRGALYAANGVITVKNAIFHGNLLTGTSPIADGRDICLEGAATLDLSYACIEPAADGYDAMTVASTATALLGDGLFHDDPLFVSESDSHLQSKAGYWDRATQTWLKSPANSPCISAGDRADDHSLEPLPSGRAINLGAYGNTPEASKTQPLNTLLIIR
ncbi:MAG: right-handed parallel beta-helix repeat-containing protein, partial [Kiritimatiellaeota bacterium]|nr:right-handed parallel beta-helix repeat-containing protein [Kiritimatiellota bacterium]